MDSPKTIGEMSEAQVLAAFLQAGEVVLMPFGDNQRYDMVLDRGGKFVRVQVKTGRLREGVIRFATASTGSTTGHRVRTGYVGSVDCFAVYCPETRKVYLAPIADCPGTTMWLRVEPARSVGRHKGRLADDYEYPSGQVAQQVGALP